MSLAAAGDRIRDLQVDLLRGDVEKRRSLAIYIYVDFAKQFWPRSAGRSGGWLGGAEIHTDERGEHTGRHRAFRAGGRIENAGAILQRRDDHRFRTELTDTGITHVGDGEVA